MRRLAKTGVASEVRPSVFRRRLPQGAEIVIVPRFLEIEDVDIDRAAPALFWVRS
jgi:hypothetical protein